MTTAKKTWYILQNTEGKDPYKIISVPEPDKAAFEQLYNGKIFVEADSLQEAIQKFSNLIA